MFEYPYEPKVITPYDHSTNFLSNKRKTRFSGEKQLCPMKDSLPKQIKFCSAISLPFDQLEASNPAFGLTLRPTAFLLFNL